jgi:hypothetical protein
MEVLAFEYDTAFPNNPTTPWHRHDCECRDVPPAAMCCHTRPTKKIAGSDFWRRAGDGPKGGGNEWHVTINPGARLESNPARRNSPCRPALNGTGRFEMASK